MRTVLYVLLAMSSIVYAGEPRCVMSDYASRDCLGFLERVVLADYQKFIVKNGHTLMVRPTHGKPIVFVGNPDGEGYEDYRSYHILGVLNPGRFAVILVGRYEGREVQLVSLDDGAIHEINGMPQVSPDGKRILVYSMDIDANYDANFIAIFRVVGSRLEKEFLLDGDNHESGIWGPIYAKWFSPSRVQFLRFTHGSDGSGYVSQPWELVRDKASWKANPQPNSSLQPTPIPVAPTP